MHYQGTLVTSLLYNPAWGSVSAKLQIVFSVPNAIPGKRKVQKLTDIQRIMRHHSQYT